MYAGCGFAPRETPTPSAVGAALSAAPLLTEDACNYGMFGHSAGWG